MAKFKPSKIAQDEYLEAVSSDTGWCPTCDDFTRDGTEPDAEGYDCPVCDGQAVVGAEQALLVGLIEVVR